MNNSILINKLKKATPKKILNKIIKLIIDCYKRNKDLNFYNHHSCDLSINCSYVDIRELDVSGIDKKVASYLSNMYLEHRFDLLGSGWVKNSYDSVPLGVEGYKYDHNLNITEFDKNGNWLKYIVRNPYLKKSKEVWKNISPGYIPIDWQKDYKSGYRYSAKKWYKDQKVAPLPGVDIKVPWELARFQHLPQLAIFALKLSGKKDLIIKEFKNQILDFIATNPVRFGVNWTCTMDVAIRVSNFLVAYDLMCQLDTENILDDNFKSIFSNSIYEHGSHIRNNLEFSEQLTANHYLADVAGLLFVSSYLTSNSEIDRWLSFSAKELIIEFDKQFYDDGGNFESSTAYHRLSGELIIYSTALLNGLSDNKKKIIKNYLKDHFSKDKYFHIDNNEIVPSYYINKLFKTALFATDITKQNGDFVQIGDNDSGHFFMLSPIGSLISNDEAQKKYINLNNYKNIIQEYNKTKYFFDNSTLNLETFISAVDGLYNNQDLSTSSKKFPLENTFIKSLSRNKQYIYEAATAKESSFITSSCRVEHLKYKQETIITPDDFKSIDLTKNLKVTYYKEFGLYIFKSDKLFLSLFAGKEGQNGLGGHSHNDKLSVELNIDGKDILTDPGTYLYTSSSKQRNYFRSTAVHNTISVPGIEQNKWQDLFRKKNEIKCSVLLCENNKIMVELICNEYHHIRKVEISQQHITIKDSCDKEFIVNNNNYDYISTGYGKLTMKKV